MSGATPRDLNSLNGRLTVALESPLSADAVALVAQLDRALLALYKPEHTHLLQPATLAEPNVLFCVARLDGEAVGCGAVRFFAEYAEIKRMWVAPHARRQGVARRVLVWLEEQALRNGYSEVRLETGVLNTEAVALYEASGFAPIAAFGEYSDNGVSLCYEKSLE